MAPVSQTRNWGSTLLEGTAKIRTHVNLAPISTKHTAWHILSIHSELKLVITRHWWLTPIILITLEGRNQEDCGSKPAVQSQPGEIVLENTQYKKGW
jgi:hypothetical protein